MTPLFPAQRAAEEFDQVVSGTAPPAVSRRYGDLLEAVEVLRSQPEVEPRAEFVDDLRARLLVAAETELVAAPAHVRSLESARAVKRRRRLGTVAASLVIVGGSAGMAAAASGSLPGEPLYPVKRGIEQVSTALHLGQANRGEALLDQASTRLQEVRDLQAEDSPDTDLIAETLAAFESSADEGAQKLFESYQADGEAADIETVRDFTAAEMSNVAALAGDSGQEVDNLLIDAADTLADIDQQARVLCATCSDQAPAVQPPAELTAGAAAATVNSLLARPLARARADIAAVEAARLAQLRDLQALAEETAGQIPLSEDPQVAAAAASVPSGQGVLSTLITPDGKIAPSLTDGTAVTSLVSGVTTTLTETLDGTVDKTLGGVTEKVTEPKTPLDPLDPTVDGLTGTVDDATDGVTDGLTD